MAKKRSRFTKAKQEVFLHHMRNGMRRGAAAEALDLTRKEVLDYIADHEEFEAQVLDAEGEATEHVEEALYQAAISGNVGACKMWLDLRKPRAGTELVATDTLDQELAEIMEMTAE